MAVPDRQQLQAFVVAALATELKVPQELVLAAASLRKECKMDSIAAANVAFLVEEEFGIELEISEGREFDCIESVMKVVVRALGTNG